MGRLVSITELGHVRELSFFWRGRVNVRYVNSNFLGPDVAAVHEMYTGLARDDDCDHIHRWVGW